MMNQEPNIVVMPDGSLQHKRSDKKKSLLKTTLYLVRHGETVWNVEKRMQGRLDSPLTKTGRRNVDRLAEKLRSYEFDAIISSPTGRAYKTAQIIRQNRTVNVEKEDRLMEIDLGNWEGLTSTRIRNTEDGQYSNFWKKPHLFFPKKGESFFDLQKRVLPFIKSLLHAYRGKVILIVTHTTIIKTILSHFENRPLKDFWEKPFVYPASLSMVETDEDKSKIKLYGDVSHYENPPDEKKS